jgi:glycosyltransferase involved in cell wall biosynthesis
MTGLWLSVVIPVFNEEEVLANSVESLVRQLRQTRSHRYEIVIADNGSTDKTLEIARSLADKHPDVRVVHLAEKGRGRGRVEGGLRPIEKQM